MHDFDKVRQAVLEHVNELFEEMEEDMAVSHQEKYALLEDAFTNATDADELKVAFEQWHHDHTEELNFEHEAHEMWDHAMARIEE